MLGFQFTKHLSSHHMTNSSAVKDLNSKENPQKNDEFVQNRQHSQNLLILYSSRYYRDYITSKNIFGLYVSMENRVAMHL